MLYNECVKELQEVMNGGRCKDKVERFNNVIEEFNKIGFSISTKFIRNLLFSNLTNRQKTYKIRDIIYRSDYTINKKEKRYNKKYKKNLPYKISGKSVKEWKGWKGMRWNTQVKEFSYKKGFVLTEYDRKNQFNNSRVGEINLDFHPQEVGVYFIGIKREVFYFLIKK